MFFIIQVARSKACVNIFIENTYQHMCVILSNIVSILPLTKNWKKIGNFKNYSLFNNKNKITIYAHVSFFGIVKITTICTWKVNICYNFELLLSKIDVFFIFFIIFIYSDINFNCVQKLYESTSYSLGRYSWNIRDLSVYISIYFCIKI